MALAPGVVGLTVRDGQVASVHWGRESITEMMLSAGGRLLLGRVGPEPGAFSATALLDGSPARLDPGKPLILVQPAAGTLRLGVPPSDQHRVRVRGANGAVALVGADGRVHRGDGLPAGAGGTLLVPHGPGRVMVWLEPDTGDASVLWGGPSGPPALPVQVPAVVTLEGAEAALEVDPGLRGLVHLRSATPVVSRVTTTNGTRVALHPEALDLDVLAGPELVEVRLRPLDSSVLTGELEVTASPLVAVGEGLGPEVLLAPGQSRGFGFTVTTAGAGGGRGAGGEGRGRGHAPGRRRHAARQRHGDDAAPGARRLRRGPPRPRHRWGAAGAPGGGRAGAALERPARRRSSGATCAPPAASPRRRRRPWQPRPG